MNAKTFYKQSYKILEELYPSISIQLEEWAHMTSPFQISLPSSTLDLMRKTIKNLYLLSSPITKQSSIPNSSVLMSYDFHIDQNQLPRLLEINTNASGFLLADIILRVHKNETLLESLKDSFMEEWSLFKGEKNPSPPNRVAIIDENIDQQKMKIEFYMFKQLMNNWGWKAQVTDVKQLEYDSQGAVYTIQGDRLDFIYNRLTDFYLDRFPLLKKAFEEKKVCLTPNPKEYKRLGDKMNLCDFYSKSYSTLNTNHKIDFKILKQVLIETKPLTSKEQIWKEKKKWFFKPLLGYGSKKAYRGARLTKKKLNTLNDFIIQEYIRPSTWEDNTGQSWKFDIRAFVYKDQLQMIVGRIYQGQVTSFKEPLSGFCHVDFN